MAIRTTLPVLIGLVFLALVGAWLPVSGSERSLDVVPPPAAGLEQAILAPVADATVDLAQPAANLGTATTLEVAHFTATTRRTLLRFNLAVAVPAEAVIDSAVLELYLQSTEQGNALLLNIGLVTQDWAESQVTWNAQPAHGEPIVTCGIDRTPGAYKQFDITPIVRAWHNQPHYGLKLWGPEEALTYGFWFRSREHETDRPRLVVQYHIPSPTPSSTGHPPATPSATTTATPFSSLTPTPRGTLTLTPTPPGSGLPDLVITDIWYTGPTVCYQVHNIGQATAASGHHTDLLIDGRVVASHTVPIELVPGARYSGCFEYAWACSGSADDVSAVADGRNTVVEDDETNNGRIESWRCDTTPPRIIAGPTLRDITTDSVTIDWQTDEPSSSDVRYGREAGSYGLVTGSIEQQTQHSVTVRPLQPATTYHFQVVSVDASGNGFTSGDGLFQTLPLEDAQDPLVALADPGPLSGMVVITATATDNGAVERVEFLLDDTLLHVDYSAPYELRLDSARLTNGPHQLRARAYDLRGRSGTLDTSVIIANSVDPEAPHIRFNYPTQGDTVRGTIEISATVTDDTGLLAGYWYIDDGYYGYEGFGTHPTRADMTLSWDTLEETEEEHTIKLLVYDTSGNWGVATCDVDVSHQITPTPTATAIPAPELTVTDHRVSRSDNSLTVRVRVKNIGNKAAINVELLDGLYAFQPISKTVYWATYRPEWNPTGKFGYCDIKCKYSIDPGQERTFEYNVVPVLVYPSPPTPQIGWFIDLSWDSATQSGYHSYVQMPVATTAQGETIPQAHASACEEADFLIVTNPQRMMSQFCPSWYSGSSLDRDDVNKVFGTMAELAQLKYGVLGYLYSYSASTFQTLIKMNWGFIYSPSLSWGLSPVGDWAKRLHPNFCTQFGGYVLIVGGTAVFPAFNLTSADNLISNVRDSDYHYTDTTGDHYPELIVGRIIGDTTARLVRNLRTAIDTYHYTGQNPYDASDALAFSGTGNYQDDLVDGADDVASILSNKGITVSKYHEKDYADDTECVQQFRNRVSGKDIIYMDAHGSPDSVGALDSTNITTVTMTTHPVVLANACLSGNYNDGEFAEILLYRGAGVYMGSTEISSVSVGRMVFPALVQVWTTSKSVGYLLTLVKAAYNSLPGKIAVWVHEFNYYGDPKFGIAYPNAKPSAAGRDEVMADGVGSKGPLHYIRAAPAVDVVIPAYTVTHRLSGDVVRIPGGAVLFEEGQPQVPLYTVNVTYPLGIRVQDVVLVERGAMQVDSGLNLPPLVDGYAGPASTAAVPGDDAPEWFPERAYEWRTTQNPDGGTTLHIIMYPFVYNRLTTDVQFYSHYRFDIISADSTAAITGLATDQDVYRQGDAVTVNLDLYNAVAPRDVVVSAVIKRFATDEVVGGLLLQTLHSLTGTASFSPRWDSTGFAADDYVVEVELRDAGGLLLDRKAEHFRLGIVAAEAGELFATPAHFQVGDEVDLSLTISNTGTVPLTGTAVIWVQGTTAGRVRQFRHPFGSLPPGQKSIFRDTWSTAGMAPGSYTVVGYAEYDSQATEPVAIMVRGEGAHTLQLPLVLKRGA